MSDYKRFSYRWNSKFFLLVFTLIFGVIHIYAWLKFSIACKNLLFAVIYSQSMTTAFFEVITFSIVLSVTYLPVSFGMNIKPDIEITDQGIHLVRLSFWRKLVPWDEVIELRDTVIISLHPPKVVLVKRLVLSQHRFDGLRQWFLDKSI